MSAQQDATQISILSLGSSYCELFCNNVKISEATCFFWKHDGQTYIVTNWHVISGRHSETKKQLHSMAAFPDSMRVHYVVASGKTIQWKNALFNLYNKGIPGWFINPTMGSDCDIAVLPVFGSTLFEAIHLNEVGYSSELSMMISDDVFVIGYPFGRDAHFLPIWKRGSIASEPEILSKPYVLIDTASRPGMSGSPVYIHKSGSFTTRGGDTKMIGGVIFRLIAIYSGRLASSDARDAQLGMIWPIDLVEQTVVGATFDTA